MKGKAKDKGAAATESFNKDEGIEGKLFQNAVVEGSERDENTKRRQAAGNVRPSRYQYQMRMQAALRSIKSARDGCVQLDRDSSEGVSLKEIGRIALPLSVEQTGESTAMFF